MVRGGVTSAGKRAASSHTGALASDDGIFSGACRQAGITRAETIEEERRLLYVAMTRARDDLALVQPLRFPITQQPKQGDAHVYGGRSRFMSEKVLKTLDSVSFQGSNLGEASLAETGQSALDAVERVKSMW